MLRCTVLAVRPSRPRVLLVATLSALVATGLAPLTTTAASAADPGLELVSVAGPAVPVLDSSSEASISQDGRYVAFVSSDPILPGDGDGLDDVFRHDRLTGQTVRVSGGTAEADSNDPSISADGNLIAFSSYADDLVPGDTNDELDVFVRDVAAGTTTRVSGADGEQSTGGAQPSLSADGTTVAYISYDGLVPEDTDEDLDVYVQVLATGLIERVSVPTGLPEVTEESGPAQFPALNRDGTKVAFRSESLLTGDDVPAGANVYHRDRATGTTVLVGPGSHYDIPGMDTGYLGISGDGRKVAFESPDDTLVPDDTNFATDVFVHDVVAATTTRVSVGNTGRQVHGYSSNPVLDETGDVVLFQSLASDVVAGDSNEDWDVFRRDTTAGTTELVSATADGAPANGTSGLPAVSGDGAIVAFQSSATNLSAADLNDWLVDVFVRAAGTTAPLDITRDDTDLQTDEASLSPDITPDGRWVAFVSEGGDLAAGAPYDGTSKVFLRDRQEGTTVLVSVGDNGAVGNGSSDAPTVSADGRYVAFASEASNLVPGDTNAKGDVFVRDLHAGTTRRVSVSSAGTQGNDGSAQASLSDDGRRVAFTSLADDLVAGDDNGVTDVLLHDLTTGTTELVSRTTDGVQGDEASEQPSISADGERIAFHSLATTLAPGDANGDADVFVRDVAAGTLERVSVADDEAASAQRSAYPSLSADGTRVAFHSNDALVPGDTNETFDVFVRDLTAGSTERVSVADDESQMPTMSLAASISPDGAAVAFVVRRASGLDHIAVRDLLTASTRVLTFALDGELADEDSGQPRLGNQARGAFTSNEKLVAGDRNGTTDVFAYGPTSFPPPPTPPPPPGAPSTASTGWLATAQNPAQASVTSPSGGPVSVEREPVDTAAPEGLSLLGAQFAVTAPVATAAEPLVLRFRLHTSLLPDGQDPAGVTVLRNGAPVGECAGATTADPDPCVSGRKRVGEQVILTVLTSRASAWNLAVPAGRCDAVPASGFLDVAADSVHAPTIDCATALGIARGLTSTSYGPERAVTRAQMAAFVARTVRAAGAELPADPPDRFEDDRGDVHERDINALAAAGIVEGRAPGRYEPTAVVRREQMASFLVRAHEYVTRTALAGGPDAFGDDDGSVHEASIDKAAAAGLTEGVADRSFAPAQPVRRDQMASFLVRVLLSADEAAGTPAG